MDIFQHLPLDEGGYMNKSDRRDDFSDISFFSPSELIFYLFFFSSFFERRRYSPRSPKCSTKGTRIKRG